MAGSLPVRFDGKNSQPRRRSPPSTINSTSRRSTIVPSCGAGFARGIRLAVDPFGYVVDGVLIEALVQAARNVADVRRRRQVRQAPKGMIGRERLLVKDVNGRPRDLAPSQRLKEIGFDHDRPARCVHKPRRRLHEGELRGTNESARAAAEHKVNADDIGLPKKLVLRKQTDSYGCGTIGGEVLAPGDDRHAEGFADAGNCTSDVTKAEHAECAPAQILADEALPSAGAH